MRLFMVDFFKKRKCLLGVFFLFFLAASLAGQADGEKIFPDKPVPAKFVHDYSGWLTPDEIARLEYKLARYSDSTSTQIVVMIRKDIGDYDKSGYATELLKQWGIGRAGKNNGIVVLVKTEPPARGIFIATGYGVEGALPDILAARISRNVIIPELQKNNYFKGLDDGTTAIIQALAGEFKAEERGKKGFPVWVIFLGFLLIALIMYWIEKKGGGNSLLSNGGVNRRNSGWGGGGWFIGGGGNSGGWGNSGGGGWGGGGDSFGGGFGGGGGAGGDW